MADSKTSGDDPVEVNLGGASTNPMAQGAPMLVSSGLLNEFRNNPAAHEAALRENPPIPHVPAQDPTPLPDDSPLRAARIDQVPAQGGPSTVRRVHDRTPDSALESAATPYNSDASATDAAKDEAAARADAKKAAEEHGKAAAHRADKASTAKG